MTHDETVRAIRKSLLLDEVGERGGSYAKRKPIVEYHKPTEIHDRDSADPSDFPGCVE